MTIHVDASHRTFLAWCDKCPSWRALAMDRAAVLTAGSAHLTACHDDSRAAAKATEQAGRLRDTP